jgi:hypothetical protein
MKSTKNKSKNAKDGCKKICFLNRHLIEADEKYFEHFLFAFKTGVGIVLAGSALIIHSIVPWLFTRTASKKVASLHQIFQLRIKKLEERKSLLK